ncbi:MAG: hypothetical protein Tsb009_23450 [Planctomycetaceae bacterium]
MSGSLTLKIRIFALAKELGLDSKVLIEYANQAGVQVKNSALASVSPEERDIILKYVEAQKSSAEAETASEPIAPIRESAQDVSGKVRNIETKPKRTRKSPPKDDKPVEVEEVSTAVEEEKIEAPAAVAEENESQVEQEPVAAEPESPPESAEEETSKPEQVEAIQPDEYVPPTGTSNTNIREMKPRGTLPGHGQQRRSKPKQKPALPSVAAAPTYVPPKPKKPAKEETSAQKPDIPLTADVLASDHSPLRQHLKQHRKKDSGKEAGSKSGRRGDMYDGEKTPSQPQKKDRRRQRNFERDETTFRRRSPQRRRKQTGPVVLKTEASIEVPCTIRAFSEAVGRPASVFIKSLFQKGEMVTMNDTIDEETALELALEVGVDLQIKRPRDIEEELEATLASEENEELLEPRPPIVTILGHVDHGKTTLLDKIRSGNVAEGEAGGITQHIAAYQVEHNNHKITFVDTPGHAAFGEMRARGASVTDIVVLVVAANDGVMPQTVECISHAKAANVPIVVAMNKIDLPEINEQKVLQELAGQDLLPAEWGGDVEVVRTSATTGQGIDDLLETLLLTAELQEYKANPHRPAVGVCLEAFMDEGRGVIAWVVVQKGTLRVGDVVLCGAAYGRVRVIYDDKDNELEEAGPSTPVKIAGLNVVPDAGEHFYVMEDIEEARQTAETRHHRGRAEVLAQRGTPRTLEDILTEARGGTTQDLPLIIKADTPGSLEALRSEIKKFDHPEVRVQIVHDGVGGVNESDVSLASASGAIIIAFHVIPEDRAQQLAEREGVEIRRYQIIYEVTANIRNILEGMLVPERVEVMTGRALVLQTFKISRFGVIAGCRILNGTIDRNSRVRVIRDQTVLNDYDIASLRREKEDVREVREGMECGIRLEGFNDVKEGDLFEVFRVDEVKRTLDSPANS